MGYTCGRRHTEESLREIAKQFKTRLEFQEKDHSAYSIARQKGKAFLDSICEHMVKGSYSTPQLICKHIMEKLLGMKCLYNTRAIITPYELDIYFPEFKLAIEYNGRKWHLKDITIERDNIKKEICDKNDITLIIIEENNRNYEIDVKNQLINNLEIINNITNNCFTELDVNNIDCLNVFEDILKTKNIDEIKRKIAECSSVKEFREKHNKEYGFLRRNKKLDLLKDIRLSVEHSEEELLKICKEITDYSYFLKNYSYIHQWFHKRGLLEKVTSHMKRNKSPYRNHTNEELLNLAIKLNMKSQMKNENCPLFHELKKRKILDNVTYNPNFEYKYSVTVAKEKALEKCFEDAKKYNNYEDFKKDKELYKKCVSYKIVKKIINTFPKKDINAIILEESKKYKTFKEFTETVWYRKTKMIKGLIQKVKEQNNWCFFSNKDNFNYTKMLPEIMKLINDNLPLKKIEEMTKSSRSTICRIKKQMRENGILNVKVKRENAK